MIRTIALTCLFVGVASADRDAAKPHVEAGVAAYRVNDFETASRELEIAYKLDPDPKTLYGWAQAKRQGGHCDAAIPLYERYIAGNPGEANVAAARTGISLCEQEKPAEALQEQPPPALPAPAPAVTTPAEPSLWYHDRLGNVLTISGAVALGTGVTFLVLAASSESASKEATDRDRFLELLDETTLRRRIGFVALGLSGALVIGAVVRYATRSTEPAAVAVTIGDRSIGLIGRF